MSDLSLHDAIHAIGFSPPKEIIWDGKLHRFSTDTHKPHSKDGWYVAFNDHLGRAAAFGSWRSNDKHHWSNGSGRQLTGVDWEKIEAQKRAEEQRIEGIRKDAAQKAASVYSRASTVGVSAYLDRKGIKLPAGVRFVKDLDSLSLGFGSHFKINGLVIPVTKANGSMMSLQFIPDQGKKYFLPGGQMGGGLHILGELSTETPRIAIAEGIATGQSIYESIGCPVVVAFSAGNLPAVAAAIRARNPQAEIIVCGDDDPAGLAKATAAAELVKGRAVFPPGGINDFNDLHQAQGLDAVKAAILPPEEIIDPFWRTGLISKPREDGTSAVLCRVHNLILILENDDAWRGKLKINEFSQQITHNGQEWTDAKVAELKAWLEKNWINGDVRTSVIHEAVEAVANRHTYHPVKEYLLGLHWDGIERLPNFFTDFCGTPFTPYIEAVGRSLFVSAVARILSPGSKVDTMLVLEGTQGAGKSQLVLALFGVQFHMEVTEAPGSVDFCQSLRGRWCCEFGEMAAFGKADKNRIKQVLSQVQDTYRASYARNSRTYPRQNIFIGTTNKDDWGDDETGLRRFLPVKCIEINVAGAKDIKDQLWAEAVHRLRQGETWYNIPDADREQEARYQQDVWEERIAEWLAHRDRTTVLEVMEDCLLLKSDRQGKSEQTRVGNILRRLKWVRKQGSNGDRKRYFIPLNRAKSTS